MDQYLEELKQACKAAVKRSDSERIDEGESTWFFGRPVPADDGFIAIEQDDDIRTIIREKDVREVRKEGDFYLVKVNSEANVLVRYERVTKAKPEGCECEESDERDPSPEGANALRAAGLFGDPTGPFGAPIGHCRLFIRCFYWGGIRICHWWIFCPSRTGRI